MLETILFYVFGVAAVMSAILVISQRNVVHSAMFLAVTLLSVAGIFLTLRAEFLAGVQVIVYVGGILVLFVFVIMLIALNRAEIERQFNRQWMPAVVACAILVIEFAYVIYKGKNSFVLPPAVTSPIISSTGNSQLVGIALYTTYLLPFEIASILLLVAIVGAVVLSKKKTRAED